MTKSSDVRAGARTSDMLRFLRLLARTGACAEACGDGGVVCKGGEPGETQVAPETWREAVRSGWVVRGEGAESGAWRLSERGRGVLRRLLSGATAVAAADRPRLDGAEKPGYDAAESPLAWLSRRKGKDGAPLISELQFKAGEKLRADFTFALLSPRVTVNWSSVGSASGPRSAPGAGVEMQDGVVAAGERVRRALHAVGPELAGILLDVCCHLKGLEELEREARWPQRTARVVLLLALDSLARHYGIDREAPAGRSAVRHWGSDDYRPQ